MSLRIRTFAEADREDVIRLWNDCNLTRPWNDPNKDIDRKLNYQPELFFVAEVKDELVGSAMAGYDGHRGSVFYLAIAPAYQGHSFGRLLMAHVEAALEELGCPKLNVMVRSSNGTALGFYDRLSYTIDEVKCVAKRIIPDD
ncbi:MAG: GNAT family acetyltransferase [Pseudomonadota bacterium]